MNSEIKPVILGVRGTIYTIFLLLIMFVGQPLHITSLTRETFIDTFQYECRKVKLTKVFNNILILQNSYTRIPK